MMAAELDEHTLRYLAGLTRGSIKKVQRAVDTFEVRPGQTAEGAQAARAVLDRSLHFRRGVYVTLQLLLADVASERRLAASVISAEVPARAGEL